MSAYTKQICVSSLSHIRVDYCDLPDTGTIVTDPGTIVTEAGTIVTDAGTIVTELVP